MLAIDCADVNALYSDDGLEYSVNNRELFRRHHWPRASQVVSHLSATKADTCYVES